MGAHTKIIDLFGTPACGKSTLASFFKSNYSSDVGLKIDVVKESQKNLGLKFLLSLSYRDIFYCTLYHFSIPKSNRRKHSPLYKFILNYAYYNFINKFSTYDIVVCDNSIVQSIVSHQNAADLFGNGSFEKSLKGLLSPKKEITYVWCDTSPITSLERMNSRHRNRGRIDLMDDDEKLQAIKQEREQYCKYYEFLVTNKANVIKLDGNKSINEIYQELLLHL